MTHLVVLLNGARAGRLDYERGRLSFAYDRAWRERPDALPLSLSLPLNIAEHTGPAVAGFIWGLLPDNEQIIPYEAVFYRTPEYSVRQGEDDGDEVS